MTDPLDEIPLDIGGRPLETGHSYQVCIDDCCVDAYFTAELVEITVGDEEADTVGALRFGNGVTFDGFPARASAVSFQPVHGDGAVQTVEGGAVQSVLRERGMLDDRGRVRGADFAAVWAELHPEALTR